ncbi:SRPBCC family protein [Elioraea rosea]|uniref:SRPBCC family protein n=1 Tax=Elioraea rosea TaxID=2492390 RepID=UPI0011840299|nr:SRPBCC domain-containing protein [Elioraea rosea]
MSDAIPSITLVRRLKAPPERVWAAWTEPALMLLWFGPQTAHAEQAEADLQLGGRFRVVLREDGGDRHEAHGRYDVIEPPSRLVFAWNWASTPERVSRVTVVLRAIADGTELTLTHDRFADADAARAHERGWSGSLDRLEALAASL